MMLAIEVLFLLISAIIFISVLSLTHRLRKSKKIQLHRLLQSKNLRYLLVRISKKESERAGDNEAVMQSMKQNIELMNQLYKNFTAIYDDTKLAKKYGNNYISMELLIEKEMIKFVLAVPDEFTDNIEKVISSFYP